MPYLSERALDGLKHYKYKPGGYTWLDDLHQPFWNWLTGQLPMWLAPNLITLTGMMALVTSYYLNAIYMPTLTGEAPWWVYFSSGASLVFYTNMDCIDGKQARRTGSSSPLGQMFDHGVDALSVHLVLLNLLCTFDAGTSWMTTTLLVSIKVPWLLAQWEEYHTGVMLYGNGWWGVLEINYGVAAMHFVAAAMGPWFWKLRPLSAAGDFAIGGADVGGLELRAIVLLIIAAGAAMQTTGQLMRVFSGAHLCPAEERGNKELGIAARVVQVAEKVALGATALVWLQLSHSGSARNVLSTFGVMYAWEATQLIVAHMTKEPIVTTWWPTAIVALSAANAYVGVVEPGLVAVIVNGVIIVAYLRYGICVVGEICEALNINCLTIKHKKSS